MADTVSDIVVNVAGDDSHIVSDFQKWHHQWYWQWHSYIDSDTVTLIVTYTVNDFVSNIVIDVISDDSGIICNALSNKWCCQCVHAYARY